MAHISNLSIAELVVSDWLCAFQTSQDYIMRQSTPPPNPKLELTPVTPTLRRIRLEDHYELEALSFTENSKHGAWPLIEGWGCPPSQNCVFLLATDRH